MCVCLCAFLLPTSAGPERRSGKLAHWRSYSPSLAEALTPGGGGGGGGALRIGMCAQSAMQRRSLTHADTHSRPLPQPNAQATTGRAGHNKRLRGSAISNAAGPMAGHGRFAQSHARVCAEWWRKSACAACVPVCVRVCVAGPKTRRRRRLACAIVRS